MSFKCGFATVGLRVSALMPSYQPGEPSFFPIV